MKEYKIKEKIHTFKMLKRIEIDLMLIGFMYLDDERRGKKIKEARRLVLDVFDEVNKELEELKKRRIEDGNKQSNSYGVT